MVTCLILPVVFIPAYNFSSTISRTTRHTCMGLMYSNALPPRVTWLCFPRKVTSTVPLREIEAVNVALHPHPIDSFGDSRVFWWTARWRRQRYDDIRRPLALLVRLCCHCSYTRQCSGSTATWSFSSLSTHGLLSCSYFPTTRNLSSAAADSNCIVPVITPCWSHRVVFCGLFCVVGASSTRDFSFSASDDGDTMVTQW